MRLLCLPVLASLTVSTLPLAAQQAPAKDTTASLPTVTVTASRYARSLFETPLSVTRITADKWSGGSGYGLDQALAGVPGVFAQSRSGNNDVRITIRGFGARGAGDRSNAGTSRGVRFLLDGMPETEPDGRTAFDAFDLAIATSIDVVRSNASAVYGNAAGGVVNVSTVPDFDRAWQRGEAVGGGFGLVRYGLGGGVPFGPARFYWSGTQSDFDGWRANSQSTRSLLNAGLVAPLGDSTRLGVYLYVTHDQFFVPGPLTQAQVDADPSQANTTYKARRERRDNRVGRLGVTLQHQLTSSQDISTMFFVQPKFLHRSERGTFRDFTRLHLGGNAIYHKRGTFSPTVKGTFSAGLEMANQDGSIQFYGLTAAATRATDLRDNKREAASNFGVFANEDFSIGEKLGFTVGARYDDITYDYKSNIKPLLNDVKSFTRITPKVGLNYRLSARHSVYASVGGGIEAPAGNETDPASTFGQDTVTALNPLLDAIRSTTYELGTRHLLMRSEGLVRELMYDIAGYFTAVTNEIVPYRGGRFYFTAGSVHRMGGELGVNARLARGVVVVGALTVSKNTYEQYRVDSVHYGKPGKYADYSGNEVVGVPTVLFNGSVSWAPERARGLRVQAGVQRTGGYFADDANKVTVPSSSVFSLGLHADRPVALGGGVAMRGAITIQNVTDTRYIGSAFLNPDIVNGVPVAFEPGLPRQVVVTFALVRTK